jgi:hypothetical protein
MDKWLRRFLAWMWAVMRHGWALSAAFLGSFVLTIPTWIGPLLSPAAAKRMNDSLTLSVHAYRLSAAIFLSLGVLYASFLAWDEERDARDEADRAAREANTRAQENHSGPGRLSGLLGPVTPEARAMKELAEEMRQERYRKDSAYSPSQVSRIGKLLERGSELLDANVSTNEDFQKWTTDATEWRNKLLAELHHADAFVLKLPLKDEQKFAGHSGALNRVHGDMRGRILHDLELATRFTERHV